MNTRAIGAIRDQIPIPGIPPAPRSLAFSAACLLAASVCGGNEANYQAIMVGDRAAGMGGAVCAITGATDAPYYNPAGLAEANASFVSVSASLYGFQSYRSESALYPSEDSATDAFQGFPSAFVSARRLGERLCWAFSILTPARMSFFQMETVPAIEHHYNYTRDDRTLWFGPSIAWRCSDRLSLGVSAFATYRTYSASENVFWGDSSWSYSQAMRFTSLDCLAMAGIQYRFGDGWHLGLSVQTPSSGIAGEGDYHFYQVVGLPEFQTADSTYANGLDARNPTPARVAAGLAKELGHGWTAELDITHHPAMDKVLIEGRLRAGLAPLETERRAVTDFNAGLERLLPGGYPVRLGFFTSCSSAPPASTERLDDPPHIDLYGLTASVGVDREKWTTNVGINWIWGGGEGLGWELDDAGPMHVAVTDSSERQIYLAISSSYRF